MVYPLSIAKVWSVEEKKSRVGKNGEQKPVIFSSITLATQFIDTIFSSLHVTKRMKFAKSRATRKITPQAGRYHAVVAHGVELLGQNHEFLGVLRGMMS